MPSRKFLNVSLLTLAIVGFLGLMAFGLLSNKPVTGQSGFTRIDKPAPEFTLPLFNGGEFTLSDYLGSPVVINFWASWCPPCREEAPLLESAWRTYKNRDVMFVGVDIRDDMRDALAYIREFDITYPNGLDNGGRTTIDYGVVGIPVTFFVNREGTVVRRWVGAINRNQLVTWVEEVIAGAGPSGDVEGENLEDFFELEDDR